MLCWCRWALSAVSAVTVWLNNNRCLSHCHSDGAELPVSAETRSRARTYAQPCKRLDCLHIYVSHTQNMRRALRGPAKWLLFFSLGLERRNQALFSAKKRFYMQFLHSTVKNNPPHCPTEYRRISVLYQLVYINLLLDIL